MIKTTHICNQYTPYTPHLYSENFSKTYSVCNRLNSLGIMSKINIYIFFSNKLLISKAEKSVYNMDLFS